jgi:hypothetical protein
MRRVRFVFGRRVLSNDTSAADRGTIPREFAWYVHVSQVRHEHRIGDSVPLGRFPRLSQSALALTQPSLQTPSADALDD